MKRSLFGKDWRDVIMTVGGVIFFVALVPSVFGDSKPEMLTSLTTAITLTSFVIVYKSLDLHYAFITNSLAALCWWILFFQVI